MDKSTNNIKNFNEEFFKQYIRFIEGKIKWSTLEKRIIKLWNKYDINKKY